MKFVTQTFKLAFKNIAKHIIFKMIIQSLVDIK